MYLTTLIVNDFQGKDSIHLQQCSTGRGHRLILGSFLGKTEVDDLDFSIGLCRRKQEILGRGHRQCSRSVRDGFTHLWFQVSMTNVVAVHEIHGGDQLFHQLTGFLFRERCLSPYSVEEFATRQEFHDDIRMQLKHQGTPRINTDSILVLELDLPHQRRLHAI